MGWRLALGVVIGVGRGMWRSALSMEIGVGRWAWDVEIVVGHGFLTFGSDLGGDGGGEISVAMGDFFMVG